VRYPTRASILAAVVASGCGLGDEELTESAQLSGRWSGSWTSSSGSMPRPADPVAFDFEGSVLTGGFVRGESFTLSDRSVLFDERENGRVYDEGDGLFRTSFVLEDGSVFNTGFLLDPRRDRAVVADFGFRMGVIQRQETMPSPLPDADLRATWSGRMVALDNENPDQAEVSTFDVVLTCGEARCEGTANRRPLSLDLMKGEGAVWAGSVSGLNPADERLEVRALQSPDGELLGVSICSRPSEVETNGIACAYAALDRS
jgi:hypothetical protein